MTNSQGDVNYNKDIIAMHQIGKNIKNDSAYCGTMNEEIGTHILLVELKTTALFLEIIC